MSEYAKRRARAAEIYESLDDKGQLMMRRIAFLWADRHCLYNGEPHFPEPLDALNVMMGGAFFLRGAGFPGVGSAMVIAICDMLVKRGEIDTPGGALPDHCTSDIEHMVRQPKRALLAIMRDGYDDGHTYGLHPVDIALEVLISYLADDGEDQIALDALAEDLAEAVRERRTVSADLPLLRGE